MTNAIVMDAYGAPDVLQLREVPTPIPGPGEVLIRNHAVGVNFIDIYRRKGIYPVPLPHIPGNEGAGEIVATGSWTDALPVKRGEVWASAFAQLNLPGLSLSFS